MQRFWDWLIEHLMQNARALREAPVVFVAAAAIAGAAAYWVAGLRYEGVIDQKNIAIGNLETQTAGLQKQLKDVRDQLQRRLSTQTQSAPGRDPDGVYQFGVLVGSAQVPQVDESRGTVVFSAISGIKNLNRYRDIEYRDFVLKITKVSNAMTAKIGGEIRVSFNDVTCEIVGRVSR